MELFKPLSAFGGTLDALRRVIVDESRGREPFPLSRLPQAKRIAGVYLLYYQGEFPAYQPIVSPDSTVPIYVGKTKDLDNRLRSHCRTLDQVFNLKREDFTARVLPLPDLWTELAEKVLMDEHQPWWNQPQFAGFGNDGSPRASGDASKWEILHPGRRRSLQKTRPPEAEAQKALEQAAYQAALNAGQSQGLLDLLGDHVPAPGGEDPRPEDGISDAGDMSWQEFLGIY